VGNIAEYGYRVKECDRLAHDAEGS